MKKYVAVLLMVLCMLMTFACAVELEPNTLYMEIEGEPRVFYLDYAKIIDSRIFVQYDAYDVRGDLEMTFDMTFDKRIAPGTFDAAGAGEDVITMILSADARGSGSSISYGEKYGVGVTPFHKSVNGGVDFSFFIEYDYSDEGSMALRLDKRSSDWMTYEGVFVAVMDDAFDDDFITVKNCRFNFTIGESNLPAAGQEANKPVVTLDDLPF